MKTLSVSAQALVLNHKCADQPYNAILLRADIHSLFDDYQWSVWVYVLLLNFCGSLTLMVYAELFASRNRVLRLAPVQDSIYGIKFLRYRYMLLRGHLITALLIHVKGIGKRAETRATLL